MAAGGVRVTNVDGTRDWRHVVEHGTGSAILPE
jgi:hypothetical protein